MKIAIVDDFNDDREKLKEYIERYAKYYRLDINLHSFADGEEFFNYSNTLIFDVIFLDIFMNGMSGIEIAEQIRTNNEKSLIIFVTSTEQYAVFSFKLRAFHYIVKPFVFEDINEVMKLVQKNMQIEAKFIEVKEKRIMRKILLSSIIYVDYYNHYVQIHTNAEIIRTYMPFENFSQMLLRSSMFICCYRNIIINMDKIEKIENKDFLMLNGDKIPINRKKIKEIKQMYSDYIFSKMDGGEKFE